MADSKPEREAKSYKDFSHRFQLANLLPTGRRGVIFVGNSRAGKSTLACAAAGSDLDILYNGDELMTFLKPTLKQYQNYVTNSNSSVTERPNFFPQQNQFNRYALVDMPGYADSCRFRELINFHYIKTMAQNLKEVRFLIVINLKVRGEHFEVEPDELKMMEAFSEMFPDCRQAVSLIVNKIEHKGANDLKSRILQEWSQTINNMQYMEKHVRNPQRMATYYGAVSDINVILRPVYKNSGTGEATWRDRDTNVKRAMMAVCNLDTARFVSTQKLKIRQSPVKIKDSSNFEETLRKILTKIKEGIAQGICLYKHSMTLLLKSVLSGQSFEKDLLQSFDSYLKKNQVQARKLQLAPNVPNEVLIDTRLLNLLSTIFKKTPEVQQMGTVQQKINLLVAQSKMVVLNKLSLSIKSLHPNSQPLSSILTQYNLLMVQFIDQTIFLLRILNENKLISEHEHDLNSIIEAIMQEFKRFQNFQNHQEAVELFPKLVDRFVNLNIVKMLKDRSIDEIVKSELIRSLEECKSLYPKIHVQEELPTQILRQIKKKIKEVEQFFLLEGPPPSPQKNKDYIQELIKEYCIPENNRETKFKVVAKIGKMLEHKDPKHALVLLFHLERNEDVVRLLNVICQGKDCKRQQAVSWCMEMAAEYQKKKRFSYFQTCVEKGKKYATSIEEFVELEECLCKGAEEMSKVPKMNAQAFKKTTLLEKLDYWNWQRITEEVNFIKTRLLGDKKGGQGKSIVARTLR